MQVWVAENNQRCNMWFLSFIPDELLRWVIHGVLIVGFLLLFLGPIIKKIPFISEYGSIAKAVGGLLFISGVFFEGGYATEMMWRARVKDLQEQVTKSEEQAKKANDNLASALKNKNDTIKEVQAALKERLGQLATKIDAECKITPETIQLLNDAARNIKGGK